MKKRIVASFLALVLCGNLVIPASVWAQGQESEEKGIMGLSSDSVTLESPDPDDDLTMTIWLEEGTPYYTVTLNGYQVVEKSKLGMNTKNIGSFESGFTMGEIEVNDVVNEPWEPVVGEQESVEDKYQEAVIPLTNENGTLTIEAVCMIPGWPSAMTCQRSRMGWSSMSLEAATRRPSSRSRRGLMPTGISDRTRQSPPRPLWTIWAATFSAP